tara:strand:- start:44 stop:1471 length:1428 start_codon:yes stop_codon:yes gene_type:complete
MAEKLPLGWTVVPPEEKDSGGQDFAEGLGLSGLETIYGLKGLFTDLSEEDNARLKDWRDDAGESGWGTAGQVVGDIAQMALPGAMGVKALKVGSSVLKGSAAGGVLGAIQAPEENESRLTNAAVNAGAGLVGGGLVKAAGGLITGVGKTAAAQKVINRGDYLTPGQAADNSMVRGAETLMGMTPFIAKGTKSLQEKGVSQWLLSTANKVSKPLGVNLDDLGEKSMQKLQDQFKTSYTDAWEQATNVIGPDKIAKFNKFIAPEIKFMEDAPKKAVEKILSRLKELKGSKNPKALRKLDKLIKDNIGKYAKDNDLLKMFNNMKNTLREKMGGESTESLKKLDSLYPAYKTLTTAAHKAYGGKNLTLDILKETSKNVGSKGTKAAYGKAPLQNEIELGLDTIGQYTPNILFDVVKGLAQNVASPTPVLDFGGRVLLGQTAIQKTAQNAIKKSGLNKALEKYRNKYNVNSSMLASRYEQ